MRIIGGKFKGRTLYGFKGGDIRPTSDNARESLFNILGDLSDKTFLDLFCGTGAVGIEAASRGAKTTFNDRDKSSAELTRANHKRVGASGAVFVSDALSFIRSSREKFDIVFMDPPYKSDGIKEVINAVGSILKDGGTVVFENERPFYGAAEGLVLIDVRKYGRAVLSFFALKKKGYAVYAGTFDPVTIGHERSITEAARAFEKVAVVVGENPEKMPYFTEEERVKMLKATFGGAENIEIIKFSDFDGEKDYAEKLRANGYVYYARGVRNAEDFAYEKKAEKRNAAFYPFMTTVYIFCQDSDRAISSTAVKNLLKKGKDGSVFIPDGAKTVFAEIVKSK